MIAIKVFEIPFMININIFIVKSNKDISNLMDIEKEIPQETAEKPNLTFTNTFGQNLIFPSLILSEANQSQNVYSSGFINTNEKLNQENKKNEEENLISEESSNLKKKYSELRVLKSYYVYNALKVNKNIS